MWWRIFVETRTKVTRRLSEKNESPRGKPSIVRKKASATMPSPVSAEMAAELRGDDPSLDFDDANLIVSDFTGSKIPQKDASGKTSSPDAATPTPVPDDTYDPKKLSAKGPATPSPDVSSKATRQTPVIVEKESVKTATPAPAPARTTPAIIRTGGHAGSSATVETPKLIAEELSAKLALPTPAPPESNRNLARPAQAKGTGMTGIIVALGLVLLVGAGIVAFLVLGGGDSSNEEVAEPAVTATEPADDSVGNLIKKADEKFIAGELVGDGGALSLLVAARVASPKDDRVALRLAPLAAKFQELGDAALESGDIVAAAAHYKNCIEADPERAAIATKLVAIETEIKKAEEGSK
jgi:hypothetical protein